MTKTSDIGELSLQNDQPLMKMWNVTVDPCSRPFQHHAHTRFEITVIQSGRGEYSTENAVYPIEPGDVFVFSSGEVHCITKVFEEGLSITNLHFEPRYLLEDTADSESLVDLCFSHGPDFQNRIPVERAAFLRESHEKIKEEFLRKDTDFATAIHSYLNLAMIDLIRHHRYRAPFGQQKNSLSGLLAVYDHIDKHLDDKLTLSALAKVAGLSPNYLSTLFKKLNGVSLWDYITARRVERAAKRILSDGKDSTMLEIALECGFGNTVSFNKAFKKCKGFTPMELRKNSQILWH